MSNNKKIVITIILLIYSLSPLKTSAMQQNLNPTTMQSELENLNTPQEEITLETLKTFAKFFTQHYETLLRFYKNKSFNENMEIEKYQNEIEKEGEKYNLFFKENEYINNKEYENINSEIINIISKIKEIIKKIKKSDKPKEKITENNTIGNIIDTIGKDFNLIELERYRIIFSKYYENFPFKKYDELFSDYFESNREEICGIMEEINNKIPEYNSFIEKIKSQDNKQYNKLIKKINNILSNSTKPEITFFENLKNTTIPTEIYEIEEKLFDFESNMKNIEKSFFERFVNNNNIQKLETKDLFDQKLNFIEQNFKPVITSYEKYIKEIKEKYKNEPYFFILKKIFNNYGLFKTSITTNLMVTLSSLCNVYRKIEKNFNKNEKKNYEDRLKDILTILANNDNEADSNNELELNIESSSDSMSDSLNLSN